MNTKTLELRASAFPPHKVALSTSLSVGRPEELITMAIYDGIRKLAFASNGDHESRWVTVDHGRRCNYDVAFVNGKFYGVSPAGMICECDLDGPKMTPISDKLFSNIYAPVRYLVGLSGMFLQVVKRIFMDDDSDEYKIFSFEVYKLKFKYNKWIRLNDLGPHSLFVGLNSSVAVLATDLPNVEPNSIYTLPMTGVLL